MQQQNCPLISPLVDSYPDMKIYWILKNIPLYISCSYPPNTSTENILWNLGRACVHGIRNWAIISSQRVCVPPLIQLGSGRTGWTNYTGQTSDKGLYSCLNDANMFYSFCLPQSTTWLSLLMLPFYLTTYLFIKQNLIYFVLSYLLSLLTLFEVS